MNPMLTPFPLIHENILEKRDISKSKGMSHLKDHYELTVYSKGQMIFHEGHTPLGLYYIQEGKVKIYKYGSDGKEQIIRIAGKHEFIGYTALLNQMKYHVTASVIEEATVAFIPRKDFFDLMGTDTEVVSYFTQLLCNDLVNVEKRLVAQSYQPVRGRLAEALLSLDNLYEKEDSDEESFIKISRSDLASLLGTAKETVIRLLSEFKTEQLITTNGQVISVLNPHELFRISHMYD
ncbi:Crp/Fnr family transcriptional regulator [Catalinimonas sp. 4WD22]|uniref:Crp/Fnr family transcriptional regulator n=1 Tax=Catalinimonas locisalis TaxID=3133978 RepID=UPI003100D13C